VLSNVGSNNTNWVENGVVNNGGGLITMWKKDCFEMKRYRKGSNFSTIKGVWKLGTPLELTVVNVYSVGSFKENIVVWEELIKARRNHLTKMWCVVGDFNSIIYAGERRGQIPNVNYNIDI